MTINTAAPLPLDETLEGDIDTSELPTTTDSPGDMAISDESLDDPEIYPMVPWLDASDSDFDSRWVDYCDRGPRDVVVSGPVLGGWGPGRWHKNRRVAYWRMVLKYGEDRVKPTRQSQGRWSFLIKNLRS